MHPVVDDNVAAPVDPCIPQRPFTESDFEGELTNNLLIWNEIQSSGLISL